MNGCIIGFLFRPAFVLLTTLAAFSQTPPGNASQVPAAPKGRPPENLPWTRFHPAAPPHQPTDPEKRQIQAKLDQLDGMIRQLRASRADAGLLADVEIYAEAARWKLAYPEEFFRQQSVADTLCHTQSGKTGAEQAWYTSKCRAVYEFATLIWVIIYLTD